MKAFRSSGKPLLSLGVLTALSAAPALAFADTDGYVEVQLDAGTIGDLMGRAIATQSSFCAQQAVIDGKTVIADHLQLGGEGKLERAGSVSSVSINDFTEIEARAVLYTQPVDVHIKTVECALEPECSETKPISARLTYELFAGPSSQLCMKGRAAEGLPEGVALPEVQVCLPFHADDALKIAGLSGESASGSAVSLDPDGKRVALRIELGKTKDDYDGERVGSWKAFLDGELEATGAAGDWSTFVHRSLVLGAVQRRASAALDAQAGFKVEGPVETRWDAGLSGARIDARFNGKLVSRFCPEGIHVSGITLTGEVGLDDPESPESLVTRGTLHYDVSAADAAECGLSLGGPVGALIFSAVAESIQIDLSSIGPNCKADGDFDFVCAEPMGPQLVSVGPLQLASSKAAALVGSPSGISMNGLFKTGGEAGLVLEGKALPFEYDKERSTFEGTLALSGTARVCEATLWAKGEGDIGLFELTPPVLSGTPGSYRIDLPESRLKLYEENPFVVMATLMTSAGARTYAIDPALSLP